MANRHKAQAFRSGGTPKLSSGNSKIASAGMAGGTNPGIKPIQKKDGGEVEAKKEGGKVEGRASGGRLDKRARGGKIGKFARGGSPFSSAAKGIKG